MSHLLKKQFFSANSFRLMYKNPNQPQFLPSDVKIFLKRMAMEQGLYAKTVMTRRKDLDNEKKRKIPGNITSKGSLQDKYSRSILVMSG